VNISVTGLPQGRILEAQIAIRGALGPWGGAGITVVAHRLRNGEWMLMAYDGSNLEALSGDLAGRVLRALQRLPAHDE